MYKQEVVSIPADDKRAVEGVVYSRRAEEVDDILTRLHAADVAAVVEAGAGVADWVAVVGVAE